MEIAKKINLLACGICLAFSVISGVQANPSGATVVHGSATFSQPNVNTLNVTNSPGAIINWQKFGINQGELTRFIQQNPNSAVLNRIIGQDPSKILGQLSSNGKVFLVNPNGIVFGQNSVVNTAGLIASTLNISNQDFINGQKNGSMRFADLENAAEILNQGFISASDGGEVVFVAPKITNEGTISVDNGSIVLAAGQSVTINSLNYDNIEFEVQAPDNVVVNLGDMITDGGSIGVFAGSIVNKGTVTANAVTVDDAGNIVFVAQADTVIEDGTVTATSETGKGGHIEITGERVGLFGETTVDASGASGGGVVLVGGDYQGSGDTKTATTAQVSSTAKIHADATRSGDGGKVIVWADDFTLFFGEATARGGLRLGDGGFIEVSGKQTLNFDGWVDTTASNGLAGTVLFDPKAISIYAGSPGVYDGLNNDEFAESPADATVTFSNASIQSILDTQNVILQANNDISWSGPLTPTGTFDLTLQAGRTISIYDTSGQILSTNGGNLTLIANSTAADGVVDAQRDAGAGSIIIGDNFQSTTINTNSGNIVMEVRDGAGITNAQAGQIIIDGFSTVDSGGGSISFSAPDITILDTVNAGTGDVIIVASDGGDIGIGNTVASMTIDFGELETITANDLTIKGTTVGPNDTNIIVEDESPSPSSLETSTGGIAGTITLDASNLGGGVIFQGIEQVRFGKPLTVLADTAGITIDSGVNLAAGGLYSHGNLVLNALNSAISITSNASNIKAGNLGLLSLTATGGVTVDPGTSIAFEADDGLIINSDITADGNVFLEGDINFTDDPGSDGIDFAAGVNITSTGGLINIRAFNGQTQSAGDVTFDAATDIFFYDGSTYNGTINIFAGNDVAIIGEVSANSTADIFAEVINITAGNNVALLAGSGSNSHAVLESFAGDITITAANLNLSSAGAGIGSDAVIIANSGSGQLILGGTTCANCNAAGFIPDPDAINESSVIAANFPFAVNWDGGAATLNWMDPLNWSTDHLPLGNANVDLTGAAGTVLLDASSQSILNLFSTSEALTINNSILDVEDSVLGGLLTLSGSTLGFNGSFTLNGGMVMTGLLSSVDSSGPGNLVLPFGQTLDINGTTAELKAVSFTNNGTITLSGGTFDLQNNANLINNATGLIDIQGDFNITSTDSLGVITNSGGIQKSGGIGVATISAYISAQDSSSIDNQTGELSLDLISLSGNNFFVGFPALTGFVSYVDGANIIGDIGIDQGTTITGTGVNTLNIASTATVNIDGAGTTTFNNVLLNNNGIISFTGDVVLDLTNGTVLTNAIGTGLLDLQGDTNIINSVGLGTIENQGGIQKSGGVGISLISSRLNMIDGASIDNQVGVLQLEDIQLDGSNFFINYPELTGAVTYLDGANIFGNVVFEAGSMLTGNGVDVLYTDFTSAIDFDSAGVVTFDNAIVDNSGLMVLLGNVDLDLINGAVLTNNGGISFQSDANITNTSGSGTIENYGYIEKFAGITNSTISAIFNNQSGSIIDILSGTLSLGGAPLTLELGSELAGSGTFEGNVISNGGIIEPYAGGTDDTAALTIDGTLTLDSQSLLVFDLGGLSQGVDYDFLNVTGDVVRAGQLIILWDDGFAANSTDSFDLLQTGGSFSGAFDFTHVPVGVTSPDIDDVTDPQLITFVADVVATSNIFFWNLNADGNWDDVNNWNDSTGSLAGAVPTATDYVVMHQDDESIIITVQDARSVAGIEAQNNITLIDGTGTGSLTINGDGIIGGDFLALNSTGSLTVNGDVIAFAPTDWLSGDIAGSGSLTIHHYGGININGGSNLTTTLINDSLQGSVWLNGGDASTGTLVNNGLFFINSANTFNNLVLNSGQLDVGSTIDISTALDWFGGDITSDGSGHINITGPAVFNIVGAALSLDSVTVDNQGVTNFSGNSLYLENNAIFNNNGVFDFQGDNLVDSLTAGVFNSNDGATIRKSSGAGVSDFGANVNITSSQTNHTFDIQTGTFGQASYSYTLEAGSVLMGSGTWAGDIINNNGVVRPGGALGTGILSIGGDYTQGVGGTLEIEVDTGVTTPGTEYDQLSVGGTATVQGALSLFDIGVYTIANSDSIMPVVASTAVVNTFNPINDIPGSTTSPAYNANDVTIVFNVAIGQLITWTGGGADFLWGNAANWDIGLPGLLDDVSIGAVDVTITGGGNANTISIAAGGSITLTGGTFTLATDSTIAGNFTLSSGTLNNGGVLTMNASNFDLNGGTLQNGTLSTQAAGTVTMSANSTLDAVTLDADLLVEINRVLSIVNNLEFGASAPTITLGGTGYGRITLLNNASQSIGATGTGSIILNNASSLINDQGFASLLHTIGPNVSISGFGGITTSAASSFFDNLGSITADQSGLALNLTRVNNNAVGTMSSINGAVLSLNTFNNGNTININGATLTTAGSWSNPGQIITTTSGTINFGGNFSRTDFLNQTNANLAAQNLTGTLDNSGGTLTLNATTGNLNFINGTISGGTITDDGAGRYNFSTGNGTFDNVTVDTDILVENNRTLSITNNLEFGASAPTITLGGTGYGRITLLSNASQSIGATGTGSIILNNASSLINDQGFASLLHTIGPNVSISGFGGITTSAASSFFDNLGSITADQSGLALNLTRVNNNAVGTMSSINGAVLSLNTFNNGNTININGAALTTAGSWSNPGQIITTTSGTINFGGNFSRTDFLNQTNANLATQNLTGTLDNSGGTLTLNATTGNLNFINGTISGGTITDDGAGRYNFSTGNGTFDNVTVDTDILVENNRTLSITNNLEFGASAPTITLGGTGYGRITLLSNASQSIGATGTGSIILNNASSLINDQGFASLLHTIGPNVSISGFGGITTSAASSFFDNQGSISADQSGLALTLTRVNNDALGTVTAINGATLNLSGSWINDGVISTDASTLNMAGTTAWTNNGTITAINSSTLSTAGTWAQNGAFSILSNSTVNLGGSFTTVEFEGLTRDVASITSNLTGTLNNAADTLTLNATTGNLNFINGTISGGTITDDGAGRYNFSTGNGTFDNVTVDTDILVENNRTLSITNNLEFGASAPTITLGGTGYGRITLLSNASQSIGATGTGSIILNNASSLINDQGFASLLHTIGPNVSISGFGGITTSAASSFFDNQGSISADQSGLALTLTRVNNDALGTVTAINGATLNLSGSWINDGVISTDASTLNMAGTTAWTNNGTITAINSSTLSTAGTWAQNGAFSILSNSTVNLGGSFTTVEFEGLTRDVASITSNLTGTLNNAADTLTLNATTGNLNFINGTISGGTITDDGAGRYNFSTGNGTFDNVTVDTDILVENNRTLSITNNLEFGASAPTITLGGTGYGRITLLSNASQSIGATGTGSIILNNASSLINDQGFASLLHTIGPNVSISGFGGITTSAASSFFDNQGSISADQSGLALTLTRVNNDALGTVTAINGATLNLSGSWINDGVISTDASTLNMAGTTAWTNNGTITAINSSTLSTAGTWAQNGAFSILSNSTVNLGGSFTTVEFEGLTRDVASITSNLTGTLNNAADTLTLNATTGNLNFINGTISGGTITDDGAGRYNFSTGNGTFDNVTVDTDILVENNRTLSITNNLEFGASAPTITLGGTGYGRITLLSNASQSIGATGTGSIILNNASSLINDQGFASLLHTIGPNVSISGFGGITTSAASSFFDNQGSISADQSGLALTLTRVNNDALGTVTAINGATLNLSGSWINDGVISTDASTLNMAGTTAWTNNGTITAINSSTLSTAGTWAQNGAFSILSNSTVNLGGSFTTVEFEGLTRDVASITSNLTGTLNNAADTLTLNATTGNLNFINGTISGGTITDDGAGRYNFSTGNGTFDNVTVDTDILVENNRTLSITNNLEFGASAPTITLGGTGYGRITLLSNASQSIGATGTGSIILNNASSLINDQGFASLLHTIGPNVSISGFGGITTSAASSFFNNQGSISADQSGQTLSLTRVVNNSVGIFESLNTASLSLGTGSLANDGLVKVGPGSFINTGNASFTNNATGTVEGSGTFDVGSGIFTNDGTVRPGGLNATGILTITGDFTQTANGLLDIELEGTVPGTGHDQLRVTDVATLAGDLTVTEINAFSALSFDIFRILDTSGGGSRTGTFSGTVSLPVAFPNIAPFTYGADFVDLLREFLASITWTGAIDNDWFNIGNWDVGSRTPNTTDDVQISATGPVIFNGAAEINSIYTTQGLNISGGSLDINAGAQFNSLVTITGGTLDITGTTVTLNGGLLWNGTSTISGGGTGTLLIPSLASATVSGGGSSFTLNSINVDNQGSWIVDASLTAPLQMFNNTTFDNSGSFEIQNTTGISVSGGLNSFNNTGLLTLISGGNTVISAAFNNNGGSIDVQAGGSNLQLNGGGSLAGVTTLIDQGINFNAGAFTLFDGASIIGTTTSLTLSGGQSTNVQGTFNLDDLVMQGGNLTLDTLGGGTTFTVNNSLTWNSSTSTINGSGTGILLIPSLATVTVSGAGVNHILNSVTVDNQGSWIVDASVTGALALNNATTFDNSGSFDMQSTVGIGASGGSNIFNNTGTFTLSSGGNTTVSAVFNNIGGILDIQAGGGNLQLNGSGSLAGVTTLLDQGLNFNAGTFTLIDGASIIGTTTSLTLSGGQSTNVQGTFNLDDLVMQGGNLTLDTLGGGTTFTVNNSLTWNSSTSTINGSGTGILLIPSLATVTVSGAGVNHILNSVTVDNQGSWIVDASVTGALALNNATTFDNSGSFDMQSTVGIGASGGSNIFNNTGTFTLSSGGNTVISAAFNNNGGSIDVQAGGSNLQLNGSGSLAGVTTLIDQGINFNAGTFTLIDGASIIGTTTSLTLSGGQSTNVQGTFNLDDLVMQGGNLTLDTLGGGTTFTVNNSLTWNSSTSTINGSGTGILLIPSLATVTVSGAGVNHILNSVTVDNQGSWIVDASVTGALALNNTTTFDNSGSFDMQSTSGISASGGTNAFNNTGTLTASAAGLTTIASNVIFVNSAATISINLGSALSLGGSTLTLDTGSVLTGSGAFSGDVNNNAGTVQPGGPGDTGVLTINGTYTQASTGTLLIEVNDTGSIAGTHYDQLVINSASASAANLGGTLEVVLLSGTPPAGITTLNIIGGGSIDAVANQFDTETIDLSFNTSPTYGASSVDLVLAGAALFTWNGGVGDWDINTNWSGGVVPGLVDDVIILTGSTVNINFIESANTITLASGSSLVIGSGSLTIANNSSLDGALNISGGTLAGAGDITVNGAFNWSAGTLATSGTITTASASTIGNVAGLTITQDWTNSGVMTWQQGVITLDNVSFTNTGTFNADATENLNLSGGGAVFNNQSNLNVSTDTLLGGSGSGDFNNTGTITVDSDATFTVNVDAATDTGSWVLNNGAFAVTGGTYDIDNGFVDPAGTLGILDINGGGVSFNTASPVTLISTITLQLNSGWLDGSADLLVDSDFFWLGGEMYGPGELFTSATSTIAGGPTLFTSRNWVNDGDITWALGDITLSNATITNNGLFIANAAASIIEAGTSGFINGASGVFDVATDTDVTLTSYLNDGVIDLNGGDFTTQTLVNSGTLEGAGTVFGDVINDGGIVDVGTPGFASAMIIDGDYSDTGNGGDITIEIESAAYDQLVITGTADFSNTTLTLLDIGAIVSNGTIISSVITTTGGIPGNFSTVINPFVGLDATSTINVSNIDIEFTLPAGAFTWNGGVGDWDINTNWAGGVVPGLADDVIILTGSTVNINFIESANTITLASGSSLVIGSGAGLTIASSSSLDGTLTVAGDIAGNANITLNGAFDWTGGTISGSGTWTTNAASTVSTAAVHTMNRSWVNNGTIDWSNGTIDGVGAITNNTNFDITGGFANTLDGISIDNQGTTTYLGAGNLQLENSAVFVNNGVFDYQSNNGDIVSSTNGLFDNYGTVRRTVNSGLGRISIAFNANTGTVIDGVSEALEFNAMNITGNISTLNLGGTLSSGTHIFANGSSLSSGVLNWDSAGISTIQGTGTETFTIANGATFNITGGFTKTLDNATINNEGVTVYNSGGAWNIDNNAVFINAASGQFDYATNNAAISTATPGASSGLFDNYGTVRRTVSTGTGSISVAFNANTGTVIDGVSEALEFNAMNITGNISTLNLGGTLSSGTHAFANGSSLSSGVLNWDSVGTSTIQGTGTETFTIANGATFNITGGFTKTLDNATINNEGVTVYNSGGAWNIDNNAVFINAASGQFDYATNNAAISTATPGASSGLFDNYGTVRRTVSTGTGSISVAFNANTGTVIDGVSEALEFNAMNITGNISTLNLGGTLSSGTHAFANGSSLTSGVLNWDSVGASTIQGTGTETFTIANGATFNITGGFAKTLDNATINNEGVTVYNSGGTWNIDNNAVFRNAASGIFDLETNNAKVSTSTPGVSSGLFDNFGTVRRITNTGSSTIQVAFNANSGTVIDGVSEALEFEAMAILGDITTLNLGGSLVGGIHNIAANAQLLSGVLNWNSGVAGSSTIQGTGVETFTIANGATFNIFGGFAKSLDNITIDNQGVTNFVSGSNLAINNAASFINNTSGTFDIQFNGDITTANTGTFINQGTLQKVAGLANSNISVTTFTNSAGTIDIGSGSGLGLGGTDLTLTAGSVLRGNGTFLDNVINNGGSVQPGGVGTVGQLTINGDFTQNAGTVEIDIQSTANYDQLAVTGTGVATLTAGTMQLIGLPGYTENAGDSFTPLTYVSSSGAFTISTAGTLTGTLIAVPTYNASNLDITFNIAGLNIWDDGAVGNSDWNNPLNWSLNLVPIATDTTQIDSGFTVTLGASSPVSVASLNLDGDLTINGETFTISGNSTFGSTSSFTLTGGGVLNNTGTLNSSGAIALDGGTINGGGTGVIIAGNTVTLSAPTTFDNLAFDLASGQAFNATADLTLNNNTVFTNQGTYSITAPADITTVSAGTFDNQGSLIISGSGVVNIDTDFTSTGTLDAGIANVSLNGTSQWGGGVFTGTGSIITVGAMTITGASVKTLDQVTLDVQSALAINDTGDLDLTNSGTLQVTTGTVTHTSDADIISSTGNGMFDLGATYNKTLGISTISADFINTGTVNVSNGRLIIDDAEVADAGNYATSGAGILQINQDREFTGSLTATGGTFQVDNAATATLTTAGFNANNIVLDGGATLNGAPITVAGVFDWVNGNVNPSSLTISPTGIMNVSYTAATLNTTFSNDGQTNVLTGGLLSLISASPATHAGNFDIAAGGVLDFNSHAVQANGGISGAGTLRLTDAVLTLDAGSTVGSLQMLGSAPVLQGAGDLTLTALSNWSAGSMNGTGATTFNGGVDITGPVVLDRTLNAVGGSMSGSASIADGGAGVFNVTGGTFTVDNTTSIDTGVTVVAGTMTVTATADLDVSASARGITTEAGSALVIDGAVTGDLTNNTGGVINVNGTVNAATITNDGALANAGAINSNTVTNNLNGLMTLDGSTVANVTNTGDLVINGNVTGDVSNDGVLSGSGIVIGDVTNGGSFNPGNSPGTFTIDGDLALLDTSVLTIEIAGLVQGIEYDELIVTGNILFGGQLNVLIDTSAGYTGNLRDSFDPITYSTSSGVIDLTASPGYGYSLTVDLNKLNILTTLIPGLFIPDTQNELVTLFGNTLDIANIESADDVEAELAESIEEDDDEEKGGTLVCT